MNNSTRDNKLANESTKGFSLIEIMVALVILGAGLLGVSQFQGQVLKESTVNKERHEAITLARAEIETLGKSVPENVVAGTMNLVSATSATRSVAGSTTSYTISSTLTPVNGASNFDVLVEVSWKDLKTGSVSADTKVFLRSALSNKLPIALAWTPDSPVINNPDPENVIPANEEDEVVIGIEKDPLTTADACNCTNLGITSAYDILGNGFVKVGGMGGGGMGMSTTTTSTTSTSTSTSSGGGGEDCGTCCTLARDSGQSWSDPVAALDLDSDTLYAQTDDNFENVALLQGKQDYLSSNRLMKTRLDPRNLYKGYFVYTAGGGGGGGGGSSGMSGGMSGSSSSSTTSSGGTTYKYAACTYEKVINLKTSTETRRARKMHGMGMK